MIRVRVEWARLLAAIFVVLPIFVPVGAAPALARAGRFYVETGKTLAPEFVSFYDANGGLLQFGYPVTEPRVEDGYLVQWTERQRLEHHPEFAGTRYEVLLGLLGRELTAGMEGPRFSGSLYGGDAQGRPQQPQGAEFFPQTGHLVAEPFLGYWRAKGGLHVYGYPISALYREESGLAVQWFERARFEHHPANGAHPVLLGHLGLESLRTVESKFYEVEVFGAAAPDSGLKLDLAQGGESTDPDFFANIREQGRALGPGLVRLDNIYNFYDIVSRTPDGALAYNWSKFDRVLDHVRAMGKEPLICLSYMPETMSVSGESRVERPAKLEEWSALVEATVRHVNVERRLGVRYWEVWNEPDQISFWRASFEEYLRLYDATVKAALGVDPSVKIGGPAAGRFSAAHLDEFLYHESMLGAEGRVDFISWHEYGRSPEELAANIREARAIAAKYPSLQPELFVTEFNVLQGGPNDTSADGKTDRVQGAISLLRSVESMQRERLDRAFLFELKDGQGPKPFWGRWGILTNDGQAKPLYHVLKVWGERPAGMLPVMLRKGEPDGTLGMMAYGGPARATLFVWYTGEDAARVKVKLPPAFAGREFTLTLFDEVHNNPARTGDPTLKSWSTRDAADLAFNLKPDSLVIITSSR